MLKNFSVAKWLMTILLCFVWLPSFAEGILVFDVTDPKNTPLEGVKINLDGENIAAQVLETNDKGRYMNAKFPTGTYTYDVQYGDWAKGTVTVPEAEFGWASINFRELRVHFMDDKGNNLEGKSVKISHVASDGSEEYITTKVSDTTGFVLFTLPEGDYKYETLKGVEKVKLDDKTKTAEVPVNSGIIAHQTYFEFQRDHKPEKVWAMDINIYSLQDGKMIPYGSVDAHGNINKNQYVEYDRTENRISMATGTYLFSVDTKDYGNLQDTFYVDDNCSIDSHLVPINLNTLTAEDEEDGDEEEKEELDEETLDSILIEGTPVKIILNIFDQDNNPMEDVFTYVEMTNIDAPIGHSFTDASGQSVYTVVADSSYLVHIANDLITLDPLKNDTTINWVLPRDKYTELYFDLRYDNVPFNPTTVTSVKFEGKYETKTFYKAFSVSLFPEKNPDNDTLYYTKPIKVGAMDLNYSFRIDEMRYSNLRGGKVKVLPNQRTQYAIYNLDPIYYFNVIVCKPDTVSRYINTFKLDITSKTATLNQKYSATTDYNGEYFTTSLKSDMCVTALGETKCLTLDKDTTIYFIYDEVVQKVYFKFLHGGEIVTPQVMSLTVYEVDENEGTRSSYASIISDKTSVYDEEQKKYVTKFVFRDSMNVPDGQYEAEYVLKDYEYDGKCTWPFNIENARGEDTTIFIVIPVKRNVEITILDASGEKVEGVFAQIYKYDEAKKAYDLSTTSYDASNHGTLRTNANGIIHDHLLPGKYQLRILDIVRNFVVGDYDLSFDILKGAPLKHVKFIVKNKTTEKPVQGLELTVTKGDALYSTDETSSVGEVDMECEEGTYTYVLNYGEGHTDTYKVTKDTIIFIYVEDEVKVEDINIDANDCVANGETLQVASSVSPSSATRRGLKWSVNNNVLGTIDNSGNFSANAVGLSGFVIIAASAIDGSGIFAQKIVQVGGTECGEGIDVSFLDGTNEIKRTVDTLNVVVKPGNEEFERCYGVQEMRDGKWVLIAGPTKDSSIIVNAENMNEKEHIIRVVSSTDCDKVAKGTVNPDDPNSADKVGEEMKITNSSIFFKSSVSGVCQAQDIELEVDGEDLASLSEGTEIVWYSQKNGDEAFAEITSARGQTKATLNVSETTTVKVVLVNAGTERAKAQKVISSEDSLKITLSSDKSEACLGDQITLSVNNTNGEYKDIIWEDGTSGAVRTVAADSVTYKVVAKSKLGYCPDVVDSLRINIDYPIDAVLNIDKESVCDNLSNVTLQVVPANANSKYVYAWEGFDVATSVLSDAPTESRNYTVKVGTELGICAEKTFEQSVMVVGNVEFSAAASDAVICRGSEVEVSIEKKNGGQSLEDISFTLNGESFTGNSFTSSASDTLFVIVAKDANGVCPDVVDSVKIKIDEPVEFAMWQSAKGICNTGSDSVTIKVVSDSERNYTFSWNNGASDSIIKVYPPKDTVYSVEVSSKYGKCPSVKDSLPVTVNEAVKVLLSSSATRICQSGDNAITLYAEAENGAPTTWIWWDGSVTSSPERTILLTSTSIVWVRGNDNVCAVSDTSSLTISVDVPRKAHIATTSTKFVYGGSIDLVATFDGGIVGPLYWYSKDNDDNISYLSETSEYKFTDMPSGDATYYFVAKNGACPDITSEEIRLALTDDILIPTVFTPFERNGENDDFMQGYDVVIYDRFGNLIHRGSNGWDGTYRGETADAGVYVYTLRLKDGREKKGTIQVFKKD